MIFHLKLRLSFVSCSITSASAMSFLAVSIYLILGLPRLIFLCRFIISTLISIFPSSCVHVQTIFSLAYRVFSPNRPKGADDSRYCLFVSLLTNIVTSSTFPLHLRPLYFRQCHRLQPVQYCWSHCHLVHLSSHSSWYSTVAEHAWHCSPIIPSCLYYRIHFSSEFSIVIVQLSPYILNHPLSPPLPLAFSLCGCPSSRAHKCIPSFSYWLSFSFSLNARFLYPALQLLIRQDPIISRL